MSKLKHVSLRHESGGKRPVETKHSPSQKAIKHLANNTEIKTMMKDLVYGIIPEVTPPGQDTYAPMKKVAKTIGEVDDIALNDNAVDGAMFLAHFHAMQAIYGTDQDCWDSQIAAHKDWQDCVEKRAPSDHVRRLLFGRELDG